MDLSPTILVASGNDQVVVIDNPGHRCPEAQTNVSVPVTLGWFERVTVLGLLICRMPEIEICPTTNFNVEYLSDNPGDGNDLEFHGSFVAETIVVAGGHGTVQVVVANPGRFYVVFRS